MINILFVHQSAELYGSDRTLLVLLQKINRQKFCPVVILPSEGPLKKELEKLDIEVVVAPVLKLHRNMFTPMNLWSFLKQIIISFKILDRLDQKYRFNIVYSNTLAVLLGMLYAKKSKIKHFWHVHEIIVHPKFVAKTFPKLLKHFADVVICNSFATKKNLTKQIPLLESKTIVIHNGIESVPDCTKATKESFGFHEDDVIVTLVGRISRLKGHKVLLKSYGQYLSANPNVKILFVGSPVPGQENYLEEIETIILQNNWEEQVKIIAFTKNLSSIWQITDIAVMPSTEAESFGLVALEAMLAKKPVVGSNHGGLTEIIINEHTGLLVEPNNETQLASALTRLIEDPELRSTMGLAGFKRGTEDFSVENYISRFEKLLAT